MKIGMIVAVREEMDSLFRTCGTPLGTEQAPGYTIYLYELSGNQVYVAESGAGELSAAATAQYLITKYAVQLLVNFGVCGGLCEHIGLQQTVVVEKAVHYDFDVSAFHRDTPGFGPGRYTDYPDVYLRATPSLVALACQAAPSLRAVICASGDKFLEDPAKKQALHQRYGAEICEMEAAGILLTAHRNQVPALLLKAVSDSVGGDAQEYERMVHRSAEICLQVLLRVLQQAAEA